MFLSLQLIMHKLQLAKSNDKSSLSKVLFSIEGDELREKTTSFMNERNYSVYQNL